eukprot:TRINITY_DN19742_c0_g2_i1.p1 TRINITY_DN19742_c0_g2~~TRINITY_DN19742_c0_g2_i1.p1  ORF type:complete len:803 (+),score=194.52 TRINITY_DN19742_c0_g2_i1:133-2541(+)
MFIARSNSMGPMARAHTRDNEEDFEEDDGHQGNESRLFRTRSNLERVEVLAGQSGEYSESAVQLMISADPEWVDRHALDAVIKEQRRRTLGCLSLPFSVFFFLNFAFSAYMHMDITNVYIIESGLRQILSGGLQEVESIPDTWIWLRQDLFPKLFRQVDDLGHPFPDKKDWSYVLTFNQLQGPVVLQQHRSEKRPCSEQDEVLIGMQCYPEWTSSHSSFGVDVQPIVAEPVPGEYANVTITREQRISYYQSAFDVGTFDRGASRRLALTSSSEGYNPHTGDSHDAYIFGNTPYHLIEEHLDYLSAKRWLDEQTKQLTVRALLLNAEVGRPRLELMTVTLKFSRGGGVFSHFTLESIFALMWQKGIMSQGSDLSWIAGLTFISFSEVRSTMRAFRQREMKQKFSSYSTVLEWMIIVVGWFIAFSFKVQSDYRADVVKNWEESIVSFDKDMPAELNSQGYLLHSDAAAMLAWDATMRFFVAEYHLVLIFRFFTGFRVQPRLGVVVGTLEHCTVDIIHFFIVLIPTFMAFAVSGTFIFGHRMESFSTFSKSVGECFKMIMEGEYDWQTLSAQDWWTALLWTWSFMLLLVLLMLNMVLAILMDIYTEMRRKAGQSETVWQTLGNVYLQLRNCRHWVSNEELMEAVQYMPRVVTRQEMQQLFPRMCTAQLQLLINACDQESKQAGGMDVKDSTKMAMAVKLGIDRVDDSLNELYEGIVEQDENKAEQPFQPSAAKRNWHSAVAERMAVQNHCLLASQWQLQQLQWQWETLQTLGTPEEVAAAVASAPGAAGDEAVHLPSCAGEDVVL